MNLHRLFSRGLAATLLATFAGGAAADTITGRVVNHLGVGVPNVNIDALNLLTGDDENLSGDFTDANGNFTTTIPAGLYDLMFRPPAPPTTTSLAVTQSNVAVVGTVNLGTINLPQGFALSGRAVTQGGVPVANVNIDVVDNLTNQKLLLSGDATNGLGNFTVAVPANAITLELDASTVLSPKLASIDRNLNIVGTTNVGDLVLPPGFTVSGVVRGPGNVAVQTADLDFFDAATGAKIYTPGDNTNGSGNYSVVVAAGTYDIEICPKFSDLLVATKLTGQVVNADKNLGTTNLVAGVVLSGNITGFDGSIQVGADVDVHNTATGTGVVLCGDNTDASGHYQVVIPTGTFNVTFSPANFTVPYGAQIQTGVVVSGNKTLNGVLPTCPGGSNYGVGLAGLGGFVPHLGNTGGTPRIGNDNYVWTLEDGRGGALAIVVASIGQLNQPAFGGTILVNIFPGQYLAQTVLLSGPTGVAGAGSATFPMPVPLEMLAGITIYGQFFVLDAAAPGPVSISEGLAVPFCF